MRPGAIVWGLVVKLALEFGVSVAGVAAVLALSDTEAEFDRLVNALLQGWFCLAAASFIGLAVGRATGRRAGRLETLHAASVLAVELALVEAISRSIGFGSLAQHAHVLRWYHGLPLLSLLIGGFSIELPRVLGERRWHREGHWLCVKCGFQAASVDEQCPRCGTSAEASA